MALSRAGARHRRALVLAAGLALVGPTSAGCQSNPEPQPLDHTAPSTSPTPSPTASAPTLPPEAKGTSEAAAKAFAKYYFEALNFAMASGQTENFRSLSEVSCESCRTVADNIDRTYNAGGQINSEGWVLQSVSSVPLQPDHKPILDLGVFMTAEHVIERRGAKPKTYKGAKQPMTMYLVLSHEGWKVSRLDLVG